MKYFNYLILSITELNLIIFLLQITLESDI